MGKENNVMNSYLREPSRFADLFNGVCFNGVQVISPDGLTDASEKYEAYTEGNSQDGGRTQRQERIRDIKKKYDNGIILRILAVENQNYVDYTAGVRNLQYDAFEYAEQVGRLKARHREKGDISTADERLSGIAKTDRLHPAYTIWLYHGEKEWDGPRALRDMMDFGARADEMSELFNDYGMNLVCLNEIKDYGVFRTEIGQLFEVMKYRSDKKGLETLLKDNERYRHLEADTVEAVSVMLHRPGIWRHRERYMSMGEEEREEYDVCQALQEICDEKYNDGMQQGIEQGMRQGIEQGIKALILTCKKFNQTREATEQQLRLMYEFKSEEEVSEKINLYW
ncbi:MAG: hypothetical protein LUG83_04000 [Lachnospiraceae bacterium]|nr:hypothetical protein [Lachnospiraceae bacterium]